MGYSLTDVFEIERKKREKAARKSASDVVGSWGGEDLSQEAVNNYVKKVQSVYDAEAQQRAAADAEFQRSLRYLPQQFKAAGLYGSGQSESTLAQMNIAQNNQQNKIVADTNQKVQTLQDEYNTDVKKAKEDAQIADEEAKIRVDELANFISGQSWDNSSKEDYDGFMDYLSSEYSQDEIDRALAQISALNPSLGKQLDEYRNYGDELQNDAKESKALKLNVRAGKNYVRFGNRLTLNVGNKNYAVLAGNAVDVNLDKALDDFARMYGIENKTGAVVKYQGAYYVQSGQDKGWRRLDFANEVIA